MRRSVRPARRRTCRGFTIVETIATIVVLAAMGSVGSSILFNATDSYLDASTTAQLHAEASIALDRAVRELRKVNLDTGAAGIAPDIDDVTATSIDWGGDSSLDLSGTDLLLAVSGGSQAVLLADVTAFSVTARDESDAALVLPLTGAACDAIRRVELSVTLERRGMSETLGTTLYLRCTMAGAGT